MIQEGVSDIQLRDICYSYKLSEKIPSNYHYASGKEYIFPPLNQVLKRTISDNFEELYIYPSLEIRESKENITNTFNYLYQCDEIFRGDSVASKIMKVIEESDENNKCPEIFNSYDEKDFILEILHSIKLAAKYGNTLTFDLNNIEKIQSSESTIELPNGKEVSDIEVIVNKTGDFSVDPLKVKFEEIENVLSKDDTYFCFGESTEEAEIEDKYELLIKVNTETKDNLGEYLNLEAPTVSDTIKIFITRTHTGTNATTGTIKTDDGTITGYTVELPRGTDNECKSICSDNTVAFDCYCIMEGIYYFEINTKDYDATSTKNHSLRIVSTVPNGRTGILIHGGRDDAKGWSQGCILPMPNQPKTNCELYDTGRNNTKDESVDFTKELLEWVKKREAEIKKNNKELETVTKQIIITKTF